MPKGRADRPIGNVVGLKPPVIATTERQAKTMVRSGIHMGQSRCIVVRLFRAHNLAVVNHSW